MASIVGYRTLSRYANIRGSEVVYSTRCGRRDSLVGKGPLVCYVCAVVAEAFEMHRTSNGSCLSTAVNGYDEAHLRLLITPRRLRCRGSGVATAVKMTRPSP